MFTIGIDLGGTLVKIGLIHRGKIIDYTVRSAYSESGLECNLPHIKNEIDKMLNTNGVDKTQLEGVCLAFPGIVDVERGCVISTNEKYDDARKIDLINWCESNWQVPLFVDNDARLATIGEWRYGAGRGFNNMVMMTIGTGIGTGVVIDGHVLYGEHFQAGSLGGHFVIDYRGRKCTCGNIGCVESLASSFFLPKIIGEHPDLSDAFKAESVSYDFKEIFRLAALGNADAVCLTNYCMDVWSAAIITYIHAYDPQVVVIGGGIMNSKDVILPYINKKIESLAWCPTEKVKIVASELGSNAAILASEYGIKNNKIRKNETKSA